MLTAQQRLHLDRQFLYAGEEIKYTYINQQQEQDNLLYLVIVDLENQEIVDFVFHSLNDKIIEGGIPLKRDIVPGYYALFSAKYGDKEIHYEQFWVRDKLWNQLGGQELFVADEGDFLKIKGRVTKATSTLNIYLNAGSSVIDNPVKRAENGDFEILILKDSIIGTNDDFPVWATVQLVTEDDKLATHRFPVHWPSEISEELKNEISKPWFSIMENQILAHAPEVGEFGIEYMGEIILGEDPIFPEDTITFNLSDLPTGKLTLYYKPIDKDEFDSKEILNYPQIPTQGNIERNTVQSGEEIVLNLPELAHPWVLSGNHFLSARFDSEVRVYKDRHRGILSLSDTLDRSQDVIIMQSSDPTKPRGNRAVMFTNGEYLLDFNTDENGEFRISRNEIGIFGIEQGKLRYREEERKVRLEPRYPAIEMIRKQIPDVLRAIKPMIVEKNESLIKTINELNATEANEDIIELDEVVISDKSMEERIEEVINDPFALDWLNEDWVCQHMVVNGGHISCEPVEGNHPILANKIPLHLIYHSERMRDKRSSMRLINRRLYKILRAQIYPYLPLRPEDRRELETYIYHIAQVKRSYTWDPDDYEDQIGSLKLPKVNKLIVTEDDFQISNGQKVWQQYTESPEIKVKAPTLPGTYILEISYWDLVYEISSSVSYEVTVR